MQSCDGGSAAASDALEGLVSESDPYPGDVGPVRRGVDADLAVIATRDPALAAGGLAATARALADELDKPRNSATSKAMCAGRLADALEQLRDLMPPEREHSRLDDLVARRNARRAAGGATA